MTNDVHTRNRTSITTPSDTEIRKADMELVAAEPTAAQAVLRESYDFMSRTAETGFVATIAGYLAQAELELGHDEEALALADEVERITQPDDFGLAERETGWLN